VKVFGRVVHLSEDVAVSFASKLSILGSLFSTLGSFILINLWKFVEKKHFHRGYLIFTGYKKRFLQITTATRNGYTKKPGRKTGLKIKNGVGQSWALGRIGHILFRPILRSVSGRSEVFW